MQKDKLSTVIEVLSTVGDVEQKALSLICSSDKAMAILGKIPAHGENCHCGVTLQDAVLKSLEVYAVGLATVQAIEP